MSKRTVRDVVGDILSEILGPTSSPTRVESKVKVSTQGDGSREFAQLAESIDELISSFIKGRQGACNVNFQLSLTEGGVTHNAGIVMCPTCRSKNNLKRGIQGATCGACGTNLSKVFN